MIEVERLSKSYGGPRWAVRDVSFRVARGEVVGFLGPNGAGKSTTLRMIAGFLGATSGRVTVDGHDVAEEPMRARAATGYMPEATPLYPELRVREYLAFRAELKRVPARDRKAFVARAMEQARVADVAEKLIGHLSKGYKQRVGLADALVARPPLLVLDEPTAGLDPNQIRDVRDLLRELGKDHAVLVSTHILPEVEASCDRAVVIAKGRVVAQGSIEELRELRRSRALRVELGDAARLGDARTLALAVAGVATADIDGAGASAGLVIRWSPGADTGAAAEAIARAVVQAGLPLRVLAPVQATLEDVFAELTGATADRPTTEAP